VRLYFGAVDLERFTRGSHDAVRWVYLISWDLYEHVAFPNYLRMMRVPVFSAARTVVAVTAVAMHVACVGFASIRSGPLVSSAGDAYVSACACAPHVPMFFA